jgi:hypothetical protein
MNSAARRAAYGTTATSSVVPEMSAFQVMVELISAADMGALLTGSLGAHCGPTAQRTRERSVLFSESSPRIAHSAGEGLRCHPANRDVWPGDWRWQQNIDAFTTANSCAPIHMTTGIEAVVSNIEKQAKRGRGRPQKGDRPMSATERQAARRRRQNESEAKLVRLQGDISTIFGLTERLYAAMYDPLSSSGREYRVERNWGRLLQAVHEAAYAAFPDLTPEQLEFTFPMTAKRASPLHEFRPTELRTGGHKAR